MKLSTLLSECRTRLDDTVIPHKYSDSKLISWLNEAQMQAVRRTRYLTGIKQISVRAAKALYDLPSEIILLKRAKLDSQTNTLCFYSYKDLDASCLGWETQTGTPTHALLDVATGKIRLYPTPTANDTLNLTAVVEPDIITDDSDIPSRYAYSLVDWVCFRAFQIYQTEEGVSDQAYIKMAMTYLSNFEREFGEASSAQNEIYDLLNRPFNSTDGTY
jgi:hypothetical protein